MQETTLSNVAGKTLVQPMPSAPQYKQVEISQISEPPKEEPLRTPITDFLEAVDERSAELKTRANEIKEQHKVEEFYRKEHEELERDLDMDHDTYNQTQHQQVDLYDKALVNVEPVHEEETETRQKHVKIREEKAQQEPVMFEDEEEILETSETNTYEETSKLSLDEEEDTRELTVEQQEQSMKILKSKIKEKIKPFTKKVDLATMTVASTPVDLHKVIFNQKVEETGEWVLSSTGIPVTMKKFPGHVIDKMQTSGGTQFNSIKQLYKLIYEQITDANKPSFENWLKFINFRDEDDLFFAAYLATFKDSNSIPYECPHCHEIFVEDIDVEDMIDYGTPENKAKLQEILDSNTNVFKYDSIETERVQISDELVVDFKEATIYSAIFEPLSLKEATRNKYADQISTIAYIDNIYIIDHTRNTLSPIQYEVFKDDIAKTVLSKIRTYSTFLRRLDSDQLSYLNGVINSLSTSKAEKPMYKIPAAKCPQCGKEIQEQYNSAKQLLFLRHNLPAIANI